MSSASERYHSLDTLRAAAMFLGILLHGFLAYTATEVPFWPALDSHKSFVGDGLVFSIHEFRMQIFFLLAGFFGCLLYRRYGLKGMLLHRLKRIALPLFFAVIFIVPVMQIIWLHGRADALVYAGFPKPDLNAPVREQVLEYFASGDFIAGLRPFHLWFLVYLLYCFVLAVPAILYFRCQSSAKVKARFDTLFVRLLTLPGRSILLSLALFLPVWISTHWAIDTPDIWRPRPHILAYYYLFFGFGWMLYRHRGKLLDSTRDWKKQLLFANLLVLPCQVYFVATALPQRGPAEAYPPGMFHFKLFAVLLGNLYTWLMVFGLIGCFIKSFNRENRWIRYWADSSYWCYLMHLIPVIVLQMVLLRLPLPGEAKVIIVLAASLLFLQWSYARFVRGTVIGLLLNGKKLDQ